MDRRARLGLWGAVGTIAALVFLGLSVYPFEYGVLESVVVAGAFVGFAVLSGLLDTTSF